MSRVVLIPFAGPISGQDISPAERFRADRILSEATNISSSAIPILIKMKQEFDEVDEFTEVIRKVSELMPLGVVQRLHVSYSLIIFSTLKVCHIFNSLNLLFVYSF